MALKKGHYFLSEFLEIALWPLAMIALVVLANLLGLIGEDIKKYVNAFAVFSIGASFIVLGVRYVVLRRRR